MKSDPTTTSSLPRPTAAAASAPWARAAQGLRALVRRLPLQPPSFVAARVLDQVLLPKLDASQRAALAGHVVEVEVIELALRVRLSLQERSGFAVAARARSRCCASAPAPTRCGGWCAASTTPIACSSSARS